MSFSYFQYLILIVSIYGVKNISILYKGNGAYDIANTAQKNTKNLVSAKSREPAEAAAVLQNVGRRSPRFSARKDEDGVRPRGNEKNGKTGGKGVLQVGSEILALSCNIQQ